MCEQWFEWIISVLPDLQGLMNGRKCLVGMQAFILLMLKIYFALYIQRGL